MSDVGLDSAFLRGHEPYSFVELYGVILTVEIHLAALEKLKGMTDHGSSETSAPELFQNGDPLEFHSLPGFSHPHRGNWLTVLKGEEVGTGAVQSILFDLLTDSLTDDEHLMADLSGSLQVITVLLCLMSFYKREGHHILLGDGPEIVQTTAMICEDTGFPVKPCSAELLIQRDPPVGQKITVYLVVFDLAVKVYVFCDLFLDP